jgi:anti-sigma B factor antagonist
MTKDSADSSVDNNEGGRALRVDAEKDSGGKSVVRLAGELDLSTVPMFVTAIDELLDAGAPEVELDMGELTFIDSSGVGAYVAAYRRARQRGTQLSVGSRSPLVARVLQISGVEEALAAENN